MRRIPFVFLVLSVFVPQAQAQLATNGCLGSFVSRFVGPMAPSGAIYSSNLAIPKKPLDKTQRTFAFCGFPSSEICGTLTLPSGRVPRGQPHVDAVVLFDPRFPLKAASFYSNDAMMRVGLPFQVTVRTYADKTKGVEPISIRELTQEEHKAENAEKGVKRAEAVVHASLRPYLLLSLLAASGKQSDYFVKTDQDRLDAARSALDETWMDLIKTSREVARLSFRMSECASRGIPIDEEIKEQIAFYRTNLSPRTSWYASMFETTKHFRAACKESGHRLFALSGVEGVITFKDRELEEGGNAFLQEVCSGQRQSIGLRDNQ